MPRPRRGRDRRLPSSKRGVSILQLWCTLNACTSNVDLHSANFGDYEGTTHGKESEEGKEDQDGQEEKEVNCLTKSSCHPDSL